MSPPPTPPLLLLLPSSWFNQPPPISYGFVLPGNPYGCLDYWIRIPPTDPGFDWKQALLDGHDLTATQAYDFSGTLRAGGQWRCCNLCVFFAFFCDWVVFRFGSGRLHLVLFGSVRFGSVRFGSVHFRSVPFSSVWCGLGLVWVWFGSVRFGSVRFGSVRFGSVRFGSVRFGSARPFVLVCFVCLVWFGLVLSVFN